MATNSKKGSSSKEVSGSKKSGTSRAVRSGSPLVDFDGDEGGDAKVVRQDGGVREEMTVSKETVQPASEEELEQDEEAPSKAAKSEKSGNLDKDHFAGLRKAIDVAEAATRSQVEREARSDEKRTKAALAEAPKTKWLIQLAPGERPGAVETVTINGYRLSIRKGVLVEIPVPVAEILAAHYNVLSEVAADKMSKAGDEALV